MPAHEVVIRFGAPSDAHMHGGFHPAVEQITIPFADRESAEAAQRDITVYVRPVRDGEGRPEVNGG